MDGNGCDVLMFRHGNLLILRTVHDGALLAEIVTPDLVSTKAGFIPSRLQSHSRKKDQRSDIGRQIERNFKSALV